MEQSMENQIRKEPAWKQAVDDIVNRVETDGPGFLIDHEEMNTMLDIQVPEAATYETFQRIQLERLKALDSLKDLLLKEHAICLYNSFSNGYKVLTPDEQIDLAPDRLMKKANRAITKAAEAVFHVQADGLSMEAGNLRQRKMQRIAFIRSAMAKRKIPTLQEKKQITDK